MRHLRVGFVMIILAVLAAGPFQAIAATTSVLSVAATPKVIVTELQTSAGSASEEFIEFYNHTSADIDFADSAGGGKNIWKIQFFTSTSVAGGNPDWTKPSAAVSLIGTVPAHGYFVLSAAGYAPGGLDADQTFSPRLADTGGGIQIVEIAGSTSTAHDRLMWKKQASGETLPANVAATPAAKSSLQRLPTEADEYMDETGALTEFALAETISPKDKWLPPVIEEPEVPATDGLVTPEVPAGTTDTPVQEGNSGLLPPYLTELLPNPASPQKDETDEYIELYNPNDQPFNLKGYSLEVGLTSLRDFTFSEAVVVAPQSYMAFYSKDTKLSLTNTGGKARLLDPHDIQLSETAQYGAASDGVAWALNDANWEWTTSLTPSLANMITAPIIAAKTTKPATTKATTKSASKATTKKAAAVKGTTKAKKAKAAKTTKKKKAAKAKLAPIASIKEKTPRAPIHSGILVAVVAAAVLYAAYEYRHDISNKLHRLKPNRGNRGFARASA